MARTRIALAAALALALTVPPAHSAPGARVGPTGGLEAPALALTSRLRDAASTGSLASILREAMEARGTAAPAALPAPPAPGVPAALADLAGAVATATRRVERAIATVDPAAPTLDLASLGRLDVTMPATRANRMPSPDRVTRALDETGRAWDRRATQDRSAVVRALSGVDRAAIEAAALGIAEALDQTLPLLRPPDPSGEAVEGCDVIDLSPALCVGGEGDNTYTEEYGLLIDLAGNDTYRNAAGGVNPVDSRVGGPPVSVNVDLAGDDRYEHETSHDVPRPAQGSAVIGVGLLVDLEGNDEYVHRVHPGEDTEVTVASPRAQGNGSLAGVGMLADLGGDDRYLIDAAGYPPDRTVDAMGQGLGIAGTGVLWDSEGNDTYRIDAGIGTVEPPSGFGPIGARRVAAGQATASLEGSGVLVDGGGGDEFHLTAGTETPGSFKDYEPFVFGPPTAELRGQGSGAFDGSPALLVTGSGDTVYEMVATGAGLGKHSLLGQGFGLGGGVAALDDAGGDDRYLMDTRMDARLEATGDAVLWGFSPSATQNAMGQGFAFHGLAGQPGLGVLRDGGGDDRYEAVHAGSVKVIVTPAGDAPGSATAVSFDGGPMWVQGSAVDQSVGVLLDEGGDDTYLAILDQSARATTVEGEALAIATPIGIGFVDAQGATSNDSAGILADLGGTDHYEARARMRAHAEPTPGGAVGVGGFGLFQGSGPDALLADVDQGEMDTSVSQPNFGDTCVGGRGEAPGWSECPVERSSRPDTIFTPYRPLGTGLMTTATTKAPATLSLEMDRASGRPDGVLAVGGTLTGPDGSPLTGREIDVRLQREIVDADFGLPGEPMQVPWWLDMTAIHAVTGEDGTFAATLRLPSFDLDLPPYRVWAGFSGSVTLRPAAAVAPFEFDAPPG